MTGETKKERHARYILTKTRKHYPKVCPEAPGTCFYNLSEEEDCHEDCDLAYFAEKDD